MDDVNFKFEFLRKKHCIRSNNCLVSRDMTTPTSFLF